MKRFFLAALALLASIGVANTAGQKVGPIDVTTCTSGQFVNAVNADATVGCGAPTVPTAANPSATAKDTAVNGSAATFMRSDGAPAVQKASASQFGIVEVDGTTVVATGGVISASGAATQPPGGSSGNLQTNNGSGGFGAFGGTSCTNQFARSLNASGAATCATVANTDLANSAITLNAGSGVGITAPGAMSLGSTYTFGATSDTPRFDGLGLGGAATGANQLAIFGSSSGRLVFAVPAAAGTNTLTFPAGTTDLSATGGTSQVIKQTVSGGALTVARLACADLSDSGTGCSGGATGTITLNAGSNTGLTAPGAMTVGNTYTFGATSDTPRFAGLGLGGAAAGANTLKIYGGTSGSITLAVPGAAGSNTITFPAGTTDFTSTGGTSQFLKQASSGGALTVARPACADLSDSASGCSTATPTVKSMAAIGWIPASNPNNAIVFTANSALTITAIKARIIVAVGSTAAISVIKCASGTACTTGAGTNLIATSGTVDANTASTTNQAVTLAGSGAPSVSAGDTVALQTTNGANFTAGIGAGGITIEYTVP